MIIYNNTKLLNDYAMHKLYKQLASDEGMISCPLGMITFKRRLDGVLEATSEYINYGGLD